MTSRARECRGALQVVDERHGVDLAEVEAVIGALAAPVREHLAALVAKHDGPHARDRGPDLVAVGVGSVHARDAAMLVGEAADDPLLVDLGRGIFNCNVGSGNSSTRQRDNCARVSA